MKTSPSDIYPKNKCAKFHSNPNIFGVSRPVSYTHLRAHETVLDLVCRLLLEKKTQIFTEGTSVPNFSQIRPFLEVSRLPQSFSLVLAKNSSPGPKNQNFQKIKKNILGYSPKEQMYQISAKSDHFYSLQTASLFLVKNSSLEFLSNYLLSGDLGGRAAYAFRP